MITDGERFDEGWYLFKNPDVARALRDGRMTPREHYLRHGKAEGRSGFPSETALDRAELLLHRNKATFHGARFLAPGTLAVTPTPVLRVAVTGACQAEAFVDALERSGRAHVTFINNNAGALPPLPEPAFDLQLFWPTLRNVCPDAALWTLPLDRLEPYAQAFEECCARLEPLLDRQMEWNRQIGLPVFVVNFLQPQHNPAGRLLPQYDLRNPAFFIARLNERLEEIVRRRENAFVLNVDAIAASIGRRVVQDDVLTLINHGGFLPAEGADLSRVEPAAAVERVFPNECGTFLDAVCNELDAMVRTLRQIDVVKLVVLDLDDTLWRGVAAEADDPDLDIVEGWPLGMIEALAYLKKRGVLLALVSKNDEERVRAIWDRWLGRRFGLDNFAVTKIGWRPKIDTMREVLAEVNLLPGNVVFVDDHPAERSAMQAAFPDMRVLDGFHYLWRKTLLWAPETQVAQVTAESSARTEMVQAQVTRDTTRASMTFADFRAQQGLRVEIARLAGEGPRFTRALELINKTNQFNTTGERWTREDFARFVATGEGWTVDAEDRFTPYGLIAVVLVEGDVIRQVVMSCRVIGFDVEIAALAAIIAQRRGVPPLRATARDTERNLLSRDLFARLGFAQASDGWVQGDTPVASPDSIAVRFAPRTDAAPDLRTP